jgi:hypothetical protein
MMAGTNDPLEPWRRQQEQLRRALEGPLRSVLRQQDILQDALKGPLANVARAQEAWQQSMQPPIRAVANQQRAIEEVLRGPLEAADQAQQVRKALEGPLEAIRRNHEAIARALAAPYASLLEQQRWLLEAIAKAAELNALDLEDLENLEDDTASTAWLRDFVAAIRAAPSKELLEALLTHLSFLLALVVTSLGLQDGVNDPAELASIASTLFAACALLLRYSRL